MHKIIKLKLQEYAYKIQLINPFKDKAQTALFKGPVRTAQ